MAAIPVNLANETMIIAELYDINGHLVETLHHGVLKAGSHDLKIDGTGFATGIYFAKIRIGKDVIFSKITLLR